jgi:GT2 family glycosyltransferase
MKVAVIFATLGRPSLIQRNVERLREQSAVPECVFVSASGPQDVGDLKAGADLKIVFGPLGGSAQRNTALAQIDASFDLVVFFDDDFIPSKYWLEGVKAVLRALPEVGCVSGQVLKDGINTPGIDWDDGRSIVEKVDRAEGRARSPSEAKIREGFSPYGCNMAFRRAALAGVFFDERLVMYSWQEDRDFGAQVAARGWRTVWSNAVWGVHLGVKRGRVAGIKFGYSQVANPCYLMRKGTMRFHDGVSHIGRNFAANFVKSLHPEPHVDRVGRLKGNLIGFADALRGRLRPERAGEL